MTKKYFTRLLQATLMCCLAVLFTACDDIFASEDNPIPAYLSMNTAPVTIKAGDTYRRKAISVTTAVVEYTSSDTKVATVDGEGVVTAIAEGTATITATATGYSTGGKKIYQPDSKSYKLTVESASVAVTGVTLDRAALRFDKNVLTAQTLTATVAPDDATDKTLTWESSDESVATVDANGQVTPKAKGIATITATTTDGGKKATSTVYVYDKIVDIAAGAASVDASESWLINGDGTAVANGITIDDGATVTLNGINISKQIACAGTATIILADGSTNTVTVSTDELAGIKIGGTGTTLTIDAETAGDGILTAKGGKYGAGIGTGDSPSSAGGNITINGGTVNATGGNNAAAIGTGDAYGANNKCGAITINGGTVTATGGNNGAAIGTGDSQNNKSNICGVITINGGTVTATGGDKAAGIGTGRAYGSSGYVTAECGNIIIDGGTVNATGGMYGAGIGTGLAHATSSNTASQTGNDITIGTGVTSVIAKKSSSYPGPNSIGIGNNINGTQNCGTITIGGVVKAQSDFTAATYTYEP